MKQFLSTENLSDRIERILENYEPGYICPLRDLSKFFNMSERSIRRHLDEEGNTYSAIRMKVTYQKALQLLSKSELSINEVSSRLGYGDPANFVRFFKSQTGMSPLKFRSRNSNC